LVRHGSADKTSGSRGTPEGGGPGLASWWGRKDKNPRPGAPFGGAFREKGKSLVFPIRSPLGRQEGEEISGPGREVSTIKFFSRGRGGGGGARGPGQVRFVFFFSLQPRFPAGFHRSGKVLEVFGPDWAAIGWFRGATPPFALSIRKIEGGPGSSFIFQRGPGHRATFFGRWVREGYGGDSFHRVGKKGPPLRRAPSPLLNGGGKVPHPWPFLAGNKKLDCLAGLWGGGGDTGSGREGGTPR